MYYYFCSNYPVALKLGGAFFSSINEYPKRCNVTPNTFIEACPLSTKGSYFCFMLSEDFLKNPPENVVVTNLDGAFMLYFKKQPKSLDFSVITQKKYPDLIATLFTDNNVRLSLETPDDFFCDNFKEEIINAEIFKIKNSKLLGVVLETSLKENILEIYKTTPKIEKIYQKKASKIEAFDNEITLLENFNDIKKHVKKTVLYFSYEEVKHKETAITFNDDFCTIRVKEELIPYLFLEDFLVGDNFLDYLSEGVKENADKLKYYLGNFCAVIPPPFFRKENEIGLVYQKSENVYYVEYFSFTLENKKIINLIKCD